MQNEYCPNGSQGIDISGYADTNIYMFCDCMKCKGSVYELRPINITKKISNERLDNYRMRIKLNSIKNKLNF